MLQKNYLYFWVTCFAEATFGSPHSLTFFSSSSKSAFPAYASIHSKKVNLKNIKYRGEKELEERYLYLSPNFCVKTRISLADKLSQRTILQSKYNDKLLVWLSRKVKK